MTTDRVLAGLADLFDPPPVPGVVEWARDRLGMHLWSKQREIAGSVEDNRHTAVRSCHGVGKSHLAATVIAWWIDTHPIGEAFVVSTAPTWAQVNAVVWRYLRRMHRRGELPGVVLQNAEWKIGEDLVAYGRKPADHDPSGFQGIHDRYVLVVIDEACGVPPALWDAAESLATNDDSRILAIGNPDDPATQFEKVCRPGSGWHVIGISAFDAPAFTGEPIPAELEPLLVSRTWVEERRRRWGEGSATYIAKVLGRFPEISTDALFPPSLLRRATENELVGLELGRYGVDVARKGSNRSVIYRNRGGVIRKVWTGAKKLTTETTGEVVSVVSATPAAPVVVDSVGVGAGVFDRLVELGVNVVGFEGGRRAMEPTRYANARAELYANLASAMEDRLIDLDPEDEDLLAQLGEIRTKRMSDGRLRLETKDEMEARGVPSPDEADAAAMSTWHGGGGLLDDPAAPGGGPGSLTEDLLDREM